MASHLRQSVTEQTTLFCCSQPLIIPSELNIHLSSGSSCNRPTCGGGSQYHGVHFHTTSTPGFQSVKHNICRKCLILSETLALEYVLTETQFTAKRINSRKHAQSFLKCVLHKLKLTVHKTVYDASHYDT